MIAKVLRQLLDRCVTAIRLFAESHHHDVVEIARQPPA
jgi:hypothetical protein